MRRSISILMVGIFSTALLISAVSVYLFHDVDQEKIGRWNEAFAGLCTESLIFTLIIGGTVGLLTLLGRQFFHLGGSSPRAVLCLFLGIGVTVFQYPWDYIVRKSFPKFADSSLILYLVVAIVICTILPLCDNYRQMRLRKTLEVPSS